MILAGAGTGKTHVITQRIVHLIESRAAKPEEILALTFSEKAALEMQERIDLLLPYGYTDFWISTFHAFGDRLLRDHALEMGLSSNFRVLTQPEQILFLRSHLFDLPLNHYRPLGNPMKHIEAILTVFNRAKDEAILPEEYLSYAEELLHTSEGRPEDSILYEEAQRHLEIARCYMKYQELMGKEGWIDFGDQCLMALRLLREHPTVRDHYQNRFRYILVDEFQDTNYAQFELVKVLVEKHRNITVVGDDDQSIFKFRGASFSNILSFQDLYPDCKKIVLTENYRSGQRILDVAYRLIRYNDPNRLERRLNLNKCLKSNRGEEGEVYHLHFDTLSAEADWVAQSIQEKVDAGRYRYQDMAILVRSNNDAEPFLRSLNMLGIPYRFSGSQGLYHREEIRDLIAFLKVLNDPKDGTSLYRLAHSDLYGLPESEVRDLLVYSHRSHRSLIEVFRDQLRGGEIAAISEEGMATLKVLVEEIEEYRELSGRWSAGKVLYRYLKEKGLFKRLSGEASYLADLKIQNIARFFQWIEAFERTATEDKVPQLVADLELLIESGQEPPGVEELDCWDAVHVMTCHKAKGLEFDVVYMVSLVQGKFPWPRRSDPIEFPLELIREELPKGNFHLEEERRLFYVALTRARNELYLTSAEDYGGIRARKVSQFVREALDLPIQKVATRRRKPLEELKRWDHPERALRLGMELPKGVLTLSFRQIDDYRTCPLKYKYIHILRVPISHHHSVVYGKALHDAIQHYLRCKQVGKKIPLEEVHQVFQNSWESEGFLTLEHEERRLEMGREVLRRFYEAEEESDRVPTYVEKEFAFMVEENRVVGRWDRVDTDGGEVRIIDYKSSDVQEQGKADKKAKENLQLSIYALAYQQTFGRIPDEVGLYFLESGMIGRTKRTERELEKTVEVIREASRGIRSGDFRARPSYLACSYCPYQEICPATAKYPVDPASLPEKRLEGRL